MPIESFGIIVIRVLVGIGFALFVLAGLAVPFMGGDEREYNGFAPFALGWFLTSIYICGYLTYRLVIWIF